MNPLPIHKKGTQLSIVYSKHRYAQRKKGMIPPVNYTTLSDCLNNIDLEELLKK